MTAATGNTGYHVVVVSGGAACQTPTFPVPPTSPQFRSTPAWLAHQHRASLPAMPRRCHTEASGLLIARDCAAGVRLASGREIRAGRVILRAGACGPVPGSACAGHRFIDVFIHGWDLANATGQDTALDAHLMDACRQIIEPQLELFRGAGALAAKLPVPPDTTRADPVPGDGQPQRMIPAPLSDQSTHSSPARRRHRTPGEMPRGTEGYSRVPAPGSQRATPGTEMRQNQMICVLDYACGTNSLSCS
jgi:hypothetical protein